MDPIGLINRIVYAVKSIAQGRVGLRTEGEAESGRINFHDGLNLASEIFDEVSALKDPYFMLLAEYTFTAQELATARPTETSAITSFSRAVSDFDDAFKALEVVKDANEVAGQSPKS